MVCSFLTADQADAALMSLNGMQPVSRNGQPADIAETVLFLASEQAKQITGAVLSIDGSAEVTVLRNRRATLFRL